MHCLAQQPDIHVSASYTFWQAGEDGLSSAISSLPFFSNTTLTQGNVTYPDWNPTVGFKVALQSYLDYDCWDLSLEYTSFHNDNNTFSSSTPTERETLPLLFPLIYRGEVDQAESLWNNRFNRIDLLLGRECYIGHRLSSKLCFGLTGAFDKQKFVSQYITPSTLLTPIIATTESSQKWWGIGPYVGYKNAFLFVLEEEYKWAVFADVGCALPWGQYKSKSKSFDNQDNLYFTGKSSFWNMDGMVEIALGIRFEAFFLYC